MKNAILLNPGSFLQAMAKSIKKEAVKRKPIASSAKNIKSKNNTDEKVKVYADEEQGILPDETTEQIEEDIKVGEKDEDIYTKEGRKVQEDEDEIEPWEEGFMEGASGPGQLGKDALTGKPLMGADNVYEVEHEGKLYRFVSEKNAEEFLKKRNKKMAIKSVLTARTKPNEKKAKGKF